MRCRAAAVIPYLVVAMATGSFASRVVAEPVSFEAPEPIQELLSTHLEFDVPPDEWQDVAARGKWLRRVREEANGLLATEGYFTPEMEWSGERVVAVRPGPRTHIERVEIVFAGPLPEAQQQALRERWALSAGAPFRQADWDKAKQELLRALHDDGYPGARFTATEARIESAQAKAYLSVQVQSGPLHRYGDLDIQGLSRYRPELIRRYTGRIEPGAPVRSEDITALQQALQSTPYFSSVFVGITPVTEGEEPVTVPVEVRLQERAPHRVSLGVGASSDTGARVQAFYGYPDLFSRAWELGLGVVYETRRQQVFADVFLPKSPRGYQDSVGVLGERSDISGLLEYRTVFGLSRAYRTEKRETRYSLNYEQERTQPEEGIETRINTLAPGVSWIRRDLDRLLIPRHGYVLSLSTAVSSDAVVSDASFLYLLGRGLLYRSLGKNWVVKLRGELGANLAEGNDAIPEDYLFRAGGVDSVRGYRYESLGIEVEGAVTGAQRLFTASAEVNYWFSAKWGAAMFVDTGNAADSWDEIDPVTGVGLGARWATPVGPIALDVAEGLRDDEIHVHFNVAIPF
jgi:translocation and assembly module TamA